MIYYRIESLDSLFTSLPITYSMLMIYYRIERSAKFVFPVPDKPIMMIYYRIERIVAFFLQDLVLYA